MRLEEIGFYTLSNKRAETSSVSSQMMRCEMIITNKCNFHCLYCRGLKDEINVQLSLTEIKRNIDLWYGLENIRFSGGEPMAHPDLLKAVEYAKSSGIKRIAVSTNGSYAPDKYKALLDAGVNDFSISLDACCASVGDMMAGNIPGAWEKVVANIAFLSNRTYVTTGIVFDEQNKDTIVDTIKFAHDLGVSDIRIISAAQYNKDIPNINELTDDILNCHPILKYRINRAKRGLPVRGISKRDTDICGLVLDDSVIAGQYHFPCIIYMREGGNPIGKIGDNMRQERYQWHLAHNTKTDKICSVNCLDVCVQYNNVFANRWR